MALSAVTFLMLHLLTPESFVDPRPLHVELFTYLRDVFLRGDFGDSTQRPFLPVRSMLADALPADVALLVGAMLVGSVLGIVGGTICARRPGTFARGRCRGSRRSSSARRSTSSASW